MKVIISASGKFHLFNVAQQLLKRGFLERFITSYPKFETTKYGIPPEKVSSILIKEILLRGWAKLPSALKNIYDPVYFVHEIFDYLASRSLVEADIVVGLSSSFLKTLRRAKKMGAVTIVERGSSHIVYQDRILNEEYEKFGAKVQPVPKKIIAKELKEYEEADYISVASSFVKRSFVEMGVSESKIIQIPYGVDLSMFKQIPKEDNVFRIMFGGGLCLRKGVHYLLEAYAGLNMPNSELLLIGPINDEIKPFLEKYEGKFRRMDYQPLKKLYRLYSQASVFVMPSIEEGLALVQPQAMACGLPLICSTNSGGEDLIRNGKDGFVIPIRNVEALRKKILYLYQNPEICRQMGQSAKERISSGFTWDDYENKMCAFYDKILRERKV